MKRWFCTGAFCCCLGIAAGLSADVAPQAQPVVRALESHYRGMKTLKAAFLQTYRSAPSGIQVESGTVYFKRPGRMRWEYQSPETKLFLGDGKSVWFYVPADQTVTHSPMQESDDWRTPLALLTGKAKLSQLCDRITGVPAAQPGFAILTCIPKGQAVAMKSAETDSSAQGTILEPAPYDKVLLEVDSATGRLNGVRIFQAGGVELDFRFGNWQENLPLADALFRFQKPPAATIVEESDLRP